MDVSRLAAGLFYMPRQEAILVLLFCMDADRPVSSEMLSRCLAEHCGLVGCLTFVERVRDRELFLCRCCSWEYTSFSWEYPVEAFSWNCRSHASSRENIRPRFSCDRSIVPFECQKEKITLRICMQMPHQSPSIYRV